MEFSLGEVVSFPNTNMLLQGSSIPLREGQIFSEIRLLPTHYHLWARGPLSLPATTIASAAGNVHAPGGHVLAAASSSLVPLKPFISYSEDNFC